MVVVRLEGSKVTYDTADSFDEVDRTLRIWADTKMVGIHAPGEWLWAGVYDDKPKVYVVAEVSV